MKQIGRWTVLLPLQGLLGAVLTAAGVLLALSLSAPLSGMVYDAVMWGILPLYGALSAYFITRRGVNNYIAWILPAAAQVLACWAVIGYPPSSAGMPLVNAAVSLVASAAGQTVNEREAGNKR